MTLGTILHLNNDAFTSIRHTIDIVNQASILFAFRN